MYKYYQKKDYMIMEYTFDSITEFLDYLDVAPTNTKIWNGCSLKSKTGSSNFCRTESFEEAVELCKYGYHEDFQRLVGLKISLEKYIKLTSKKNKQYNYYVGYTPDVKAYLDGNPLSMLNRENPTRRHIDIYYNIGVPWQVTSGQIFNRGAITLNLVEILENMGFSVDLNIFDIGHEDKLIHYAKFNLKKSGERLNIQKLYFPMCHPSFLRRLLFRLEEVTPDITRDFTDGYGHACDDYTTRDVLDLKENDMVICLPSEMCVRGENIIDDANNMFDYINKFTSEDIKFEQVKRLMR